MSNSKAGTIYIVKNPHYAVNYYKVGKTSRTADDRLKDATLPILKYSINRNVFVIWEGTPKASLLNEGKIPTLQKIND